MTDAEPFPPTIAWVDDHVVLIDQRRLPGELVMVEARTVAELCALIESLAVRGAPGARCRRSHGRGARRRVGRVVGRGAPAGGGHPPDRGQPGLGGRPGPGGNGSGGRGGPRGERGRGTQPGAGSLRRRARPGRGPGPDPLQRGSARLRRLRHRSGGHPRRPRTGSTPVGVGGRDPARAPGRPAHRLGARSSRHRLHRRGGRDGGVAHGRGRGGSGGGRRRSGRRQRGRGQQDRHLRPGGAGPPPSGPVLRGGADVHGRSRDA